MFHSCQKVIRNHAEVEHQISSLASRDDRWIALIIFVFRKNLILNFVQVYMITAEGLLAQKKGLVVNYFDSVSVYEDPIRYDVYSWNVALESYQMLAEVVEEDVVILQRKRADVLGLL